MSEEVQNKEASLEEIVNNTSIADIYRAAKQLDGIVSKTKLIESQFFSDLCGNTIYPHQLFKIFFISSINATPPIASFE